MIEELRKIDGLIRELNEIEQLLGRALGYPKYVDASTSLDSDSHSQNQGVRVGEHVPVSIAQEAANKIRELTQELSAARSKIAYYEAPLPLFVDEEDRYRQVNDHRFSDDGVCVRCGEDAEEWDAGCVEKITNELLDAIVRAQAAGNETANLRDGITKAVNMPWIVMEQPLGGKAYRCPDDIAIIAFVAELAQRAKALP